jgi:glutamyl/glutaminyl-tRNA synthetase
MQDKQLPIRTRMAPSPTGEMHVASYGDLLKKLCFAKTASWPVYFKN